MAEFWWTSSRCHIFPAISGVLLMDSVDHQVWVTKPYKTQEPTINPQFWVAKKTVLLAKVLNLKFLIYPRIPVGMIFWHILNQPKTRFCHPKVFPFICPHDMLSRNSHYIPMFLFIYIYIHIHLNKSLSIYLIYIYMCVCVGPPVIYIYIYGIYGIYHQSISHSPSALRRRPGDGEILHPSQLCRWQLPQLRRHHQALGAAGVAWIRREKRRGTQGMPRKRSIFNEKNGGKFIGTMMMIAKLSWFIFKVQKSYWNMLKIYVLGGTYGYVWVISDTQVAFENLWDSKSHVLIALQLLGSW